MKTNGGRRSYQEGMVLLEVIIALTFFSVVSLGLIVALSRSMDTAQDRHVIITAQRGLENQLALLRGSSLVTGERKISDEANGLLYRVTIVPEPMEDQNHKAVLGIYRATVTASWKQEGHAESRDVSQLFYQP